MLSFKKNKKIRVAINGAGRIGRAFYKLAHGRKDMEVVALNDLTPVSNIAYLLKYDSVYGPSHLDVKVDVNGKDLVIDGKVVSYLSEKDPAMLPWKDMNIDVVVESTGLFTDFNKAKAHVTAGAKRVVISAPAKGGETCDVANATVLLGLNHDKLKDVIISSNASCTTNASSPMIAILDEAIGIEKAVLNTVHAYTASQSIVDGPSKKDNREGRAGTSNIVPTSTGAATAVTKVLTGLSGKFDGISIRVPVIAGSLVDITFISKKDTTVEEVNNALKEASESDRWKGIFTIADADVVSSDIKGSLFASIADLGLTRVVGGNLVKVFAWYDNEMGYTHTLVEHVIKTGQYIKRD